MDRTLRRYSGPPGQEDMPYLLTPGRSPPRAR